MSNDKTSIPSTYNVSVEESDRIAKDAAIGSCVAEKAARRANMSREGITTAKASAVGAIVALEMQRTR